jgi:hypothetical protein
MSQFFPLRLDRGAPIVGRVPDQQGKEVVMSHVTYKIVQHDGGWAYTVDGVFSEPFPAHEEAIGAAKQAAAEQRVPGRTEVIEYETADGKWHTETAFGSDRPETDVEDTP